MTLFAEKVWRAVRKIPKGKVSTYAAVARAIGNPHSARAVGNALNKNPDMIKTPCHRVVRSDGRVGGYASGVRKKMLILKKEGVGVSKNRIHLKRFGFAFGK